MKKGTSGKMGVTLAFFTGANSVQCAGTCKTSVMSKLQRQGSVARKVWTCRFSTLMLLKRLAELQGEHRMREALGEQP